MEMTVAQLTMKEDLCRRIMDLPIETVEQISRYVDDFEPHEPNEETIAAIEESMNPETLIECDDIDDMFRKCGVNC
jgi:hypothetical protein